MNDVIDLRTWRQARGREAGAPSQPPQHGGDRLDRAVDRLSLLVDRGLNKAGRLEPKVETELLAIIGQLTVGLVHEATDRAERLADRLASRPRAIGR